MTRKKKEALMLEIEELWNSGHGEALCFWGDRQIRLYKQGMLIGALVFGALHLVYHAYNPKAGN